MALLISIVVIVAMFFVVLQYPVLIFPGVAILWFIDKHYAKLPQFGELLMAILGLSGILGMIYPVLAYIGLVPW